MRKLVVCAAAWIALVSVSFAAPPPPPPPPPAELAEELEGYETNALWTNYGLWITQRMGAARAISLDLAPPPPSAARRGSRSYTQRGPTFRVYLDESGGEESGVEIRIDRVCSSEPWPDFRCLWTARKADNPHYGAAGEFLRANFNLERAVEYLKARGITPPAVPPYQPQSFDLPDPVGQDVPAFVRFVQVSEDECPQVREALMALQRASAEISLSHVRPDNTQDQPAPAPHSYLFELTIPNWFATRRGDRTYMWSKVTLRGVGDRTIHALGELMTKPLRHCAGFQ